jgi:hypothetical protein
LHESREISEGEQPIAVTVELTHYSSSIRLRDGAALLLQRLI